MDIPETIDLPEIEKIRSDTQHPLHTAYRDGNERLISKIDEAYQRHYAQGDPAKGSEDIDRERELKEKYGEGEGDPDDVEALQNHFREHFGADAQPAAQAIVDMINTMPEDTQRDMEQRYPGLLEDSKVWDFLWQLHKKGSSR